MAEEDGGDAKAKWAAEAYAFLSLFRRMHGRLTGLLMLGLGWGLLVRLAAPLLEKPPAPREAWAPAQGAERMTATQVFVVGAVVIALYWFLSGGAWRLLYFGFARVARPLGSFLLQAGFAVFVIVSTPLLLPAVLLDFLHFNRWIRRTYGDRPAAVRAKLAEPALRELYRKEPESTAGTPLSFEEWKALKGEKWVSGKESELTDFTLRSAFESKVKWHALRPWQDLRALVDKGRTRLDSTALIGLAPFHSYSFDEEQKSAKAPLQIFAAAIRRLRLGLTDPMIANHVRFVTIPDIVSIASEDAARRWRRWLGLDTLLWGSYVSASPPRIWLNLENKPQKDEEPPERSRHESGLDWDPFRSEDVDIAMMEVDQENPVDVYLVVLVCFLRTLKRRSKRSKLLFFLEAQDTLYWKTSSSERIFMRLVSPLLPNIDQLPQLQGLDSTPRHFLITYISSWAAYQIKWSDPSKAGELRLLKDLLEHCVRIAPYSAENHYRLGAVLCLADQEQAARAAFAKAQQLDSQVQFHNPADIGIYAEVTVRLAYDGSRPSPGGCAAAVAFAARALKLGSPDTAARIAKEFLQTDYWKMQELHNKYGGGATWSVADRILCSLIGIDLPKPPDNSPAS